MRRLQLCRAPFAAILLSSAINAQQTRPEDPPPPEPRAPAGEAPSVAPPGATAPPQRRPGQRLGANVPVPENLELIRDVVYATAPDKDGKPVELRMDCTFLKRSDGQPMPVVMYIHGGGWSGGDRAMGVPLSFPFAQGGYFACTISYRLSGQATFPAQLHDVKAAVRFIRDNADKLAIDPDRIGVWGHSAGGHLSALLGTTGDVKELEGDVGEKHGNSTVQAVVDVSGPSDLLLIAPGGNGGPMISGLLGGTVEEKHDLAKQASPVNHVDAKDAPFLIIQGGNDRLVPDVQAEVMRDALKKAGVEVEYLYIEDAGHGVPDRRALFATAEFFDKHLGGHAAEAMADMARRLPNGAGGGAGGGGGGAGAGGGDGRPRRQGQQPAAARPDAPPTSQPQ